MQQRYSLQVGMLNLYLSFKLISSPPALSLLSSTRRQWLSMENGVLQSQPRLTTMFVSQVLWTWTLTIAYFSRHFLPFRVQCHFIQADYQ